MGVCLESPLKQSVSRCGIQVEEKVINESCLLKVDLINTSRFVLLPFCLFTPMAAGVTFPFHSFYFGKVTYAAAGLRERIDCCYAAGLGFCGLWTPAIYFS